MSQRRLRSVPLSGPRRRAETAQVELVVDDGTLKVSLDGRIESVRLIGVATPETVQPQKPVEFFGKEASAFTKRMAEGKTVRLEGAPVLLGARKGFEKPIKMTELLEDIRAAIADTKAVTLPAELLG